jgi:hypothetical protein
MPGAPRPSLSHLNTSLVPPNSQHGSTRLPTRPMARNTDVVTGSYRLPVSFLMRATTVAAVIGSSANSPPAAIVVQIQSPGQIPRPKTPCSPDRSPPTSATTPSTRPDYAKWAIARRATCQAGAFKTLNVRKGAVEAVGHLIYATDPKVITFELVTGQKPVTYTAPTFGQITERYIPRPSPPTATPTTPNGRSPVRTRTPFMNST